MGHVFRARRLFRYGDVVWSYPSAAGLAADLNESLKSASRGATGGRKHVRAGLVVAEVALSMVLLFAAGLLLRSFWQIESVPLGFEPTRLLTGDRSPARTATPQSF